MLARCPRCQTTYVAEAGRRGYCLPCRSLRTKAWQAREERLRNGERIDVDWSAAPLAARYGVP